VTVSLALADSKHLRATRRADALGGRLAVFHGDNLGVLHFLLGATFHTISLHVRISSHSFAMKIYHLTHISQVPVLVCAYKMGVI
jgi:hypothetical protein